MIFVTVGTQLAFDRMISAIDNLNAEVKAEVFAQIGPSAITPQYIDFIDFMTPNEADEKFKEATLIVAHAGMGSILTALKYEKPILIMPRKAALEEHRNDHQIATANWVKGLKGVTVAQDENELVDLLKNSASIISGDSIPQYAEDKLISFLKNEINF